MAPIRFAERLLKGEPLPIYNNGNMLRDFTYIEDIIKGVLLIVEKNVEKGERRVLNIGRGEKVDLMEFVKLLAQHLGVEPKVSLMPMQNGDVPRTLADTSLLKSLCGYEPVTSVNDGLKAFADWFLDYY